MGVLGSLWLLLLKMLLQNNSHSVSSLMCWRFQISAWYLVTWYTVPWNRSWHIIAKLIFSVFHWTSAMSDIDHVRHWPRLRDDFSAQLVKDSRYLPTVGQCDWCTVTMKQSHIYIASILNSLRISVSACNLVRMMTHMQHHETDCH